MPHAFSLASFRAFRGSKNHQCQSVSISGYPFSFLVSRFWFLVTPDLRPPTVMGRHLHFSISIPIPISISISNRRFRTARSEFLVHEDSSAGFSRGGFVAQVPRTADESALVNPRERGTLNEADGPSKISCPMLSAWQAFVFFVVQKIITANQRQSVVQLFPIDFERGSGRPVRSSSFTRIHPQALAEEAS